MPAATADQAFAAGNRVHAGGAIEPRIDVPRAGHLKCGKALERAQRGHNLLRDDLGRLAQLARQLKGNRRGQLAKFQLRRNLQRNGLELEIVLGLQNRAEMLAEPFLQFQIHVDMPQKSLIFKVILTDCGARDSPAFDAHRAEPT